MVQLDHFSASRSRNGRHGIVSPLHLPPPGIARWSAFSPGPPIPSPRPPIGRSATLRTDGRSMSPHPSGSSEHPFIGQYMRSDQTDDLPPRVGRLRRVPRRTGWFILPVRPERRPLRFVSTNPDAQVSARRGPFPPRSWIRFAHQTCVDRASEAPGPPPSINTGFRPEPRTKSRLQFFTYFDLKATRAPAGRPINPYLVEGPDISSSNLPRSRALPAVHYGSKPADGGNLSLKREDYLASQWIRS